MWDELPSGVKKNCIISHLKLKHCSHDTVCVNAKEQQRKSEQNPSVNTIKFLWGN